MSYYYLDALDLVLSQAVGDSDSDSTFHVESLGVLADIMHSCPDVPNIYGNVVLLVGDNELAQLASVDTSNNTIGVIRGDNPYGGVQAHEAGTHVRAVIDSTLLSDLRTGGKGAGSPTQTTVGQYFDGDRFLDTSTGEVWVYSQAWNKVAYPSYPDSIEHSFTLDDDVTFHVGKNMIDHDALPINTTVVVSSNWSSYTNNGGAFDTGSLAQPVAGDFSWATRTLAQFTQLQVGDILVVDGSGERFTHIVNNVQVDNNSNIETVAWRWGPYYANGDFTPPGNFNITLVRPSALSDTTTTYTCSNVDVKAYTVAGNVPKPPDSGGGIF